MTQAEAHLKRLLMSGGVAVVVTASMPFPQQQKESVLRANEASYVSAWGAVEQQEGDGLQYARAVRGNERMQRAQPGLGLFPTCRGLPVRLPRFGFAAVACRGRFLPKGWTRASLIPSRCLFTSGSQHHSYPAPPRYTACALTRCMPQPSLFLALPS